MSPLGGAAGATQAAAIPASVRREGSAAVDGYRAALAFEAELLKQLLSEALPEAGGGEGGAAEAGEPGLGSDPRLAGLPETFAEAIGAGGGIGLAGQLYHSFEADR